MIIDLAISGAILAIFVLYLFLRRIRIVSIVAFAIPISVFSSFYFFYLFGISINTLTLTGIALAVGMLLDNSVVVMENIYRLKGLGVPDDEACVQGTEEVWKSIVAATVTTITVFLPFLFAEDYMIKLIGEHVGVSIVATLTLSLVVALLLVPMAMNAILKKQKGMVNFNNLSIHNRLIQMYMAILKMALRRPTRVILISLVVLFVTVVLSTSLSLNTLREVESDTFQVYVTSPSGYTLDKTDECIRLFEAELKEIPEVEEFTAEVFAEDASITIKLKEDYEVTGVEMDTLAEEAWKIDGVIGSRMTGGGFGGCTVSLVKDEAIDEFKEKVGKAYTEKTGLKADFYIAEIGDGAKKI